MITTFYSSIFRTGERTCEFLQFYTELFRSGVKFEDFLFPLALFGSASAQSQLEFSVSTDENPLKTKSSQIMPTLVWRAHGLNIFTHDIDL